MHKNVFFKWWEPFYNQNIIDNWMYTLHVYSFFKNKHITKKEHMWRWKKSWIIILRCNISDKGSTLLFQMSFRYNNIKTKDVIQKSSILQVFPILKGHNSCMVSATIWKIHLDLYFMINIKYAKVESHMLRQTKVTVQ